jgi:hypothetical protein
LNSATSCAQKTRTSRFFATSSRNRCYGNSTLSDEAVGIDIDGHTNAAGEVDVAEPSANDVLDIECAAGVNEKALTVAPA